MKKCGRILLLMLLLMAVLTLPVFAADAAEQNNIYNEQWKASGAEDLPNKLPEETQSQLNSIGISGADWSSIQSLTPDSLFASILNITGEKSKNPLKAAAAVIGIMLLCALLEGMKLSFGERQLSGVIGMVSTLCVCVIVVQPIVACIGDANNVIKAAAGFMLCTIPVITGIMIAGGQTVSAASYNMLMVGAGNVISMVASGFLVPLLNSFLALSIVSSVSPRLSLSGICDTFSKVTKWVLGFCMTVFVGLLTVQGLIGAAADSATSKTAKFVLSSFVPVVGSALGDAFTTVQSCVKLLKSGVGAFGLIAAGFIFLPSIIECLLWQITVNVCAAVGDIFELKQITGLLRAAGKVIGTIIAIMLCCATILMVSTVLMLMLGGDAN